MSRAESDAVSAAHNGSACVCIRGPDPTQQRAHSRAFYLSDDGVTAFSGSGVLLPPDPETPHKRHVLVPMSLLRPFAAPDDRSSRATAAQSSTPRLIPGVEIYVLIGEGSKSQWVPASPLGVFNVSAAEQALDSFIARAPSWSIGWAVNSPASTAPRANYQFRSQQIAPAPPQVLPPSASTHRDGQDTAAASLPSNAPPFPPPLPSPLPIPPLSSATAFPPSSLPRRAPTKPFHRSMHPQSPAPPPLPAAAPFSPPDLSLTQVSDTCQLALIELELEPAAAGPGIDLTSPPDLAQGERVIVSGSPFGVIAPAHFTNSVTIGIVSNALRSSAPASPPYGVSPGRESSSEYAPLLMLDIRVLPGMEGAPVVTPDGALAGILLPPLVQGFSTSEIPLMLTSSALLKALNSSAVSSSLRPLLHSSSRSSLSPSRPLSFSTHRRHPVASLSTVHSPLQQANAERTSPLSMRQTCSAAVQSESSERQGRSAGMLQHARRLPLGPGVGVRPELIERARQGVVLLDAGGEWATGVVLSHDGLIVTNAHLVLPSRQPDPSGAALPAAASWAGVRDGEEGKPHCRWKPEPSESGDWRTTALQLLPEPPPQAIQRVRVRFLHSAGATWRSARLLFVSQGPNDVALLKADMATDPRPGTLHTGARGTSPTETNSLGAKMEEPEVQGLRLATEGARAGDAVAVLGHGLLGPAAGLGPCVHEGVVSRLVNRGGTAGPAIMLQTTAAVHPGCSGGAVIDHTGALLGLVTGNAKHTRGDMLPHLNFSLSASMLRPLWELHTSAGSEAMRAPSRSPAEVAQGVAALGETSGASTELWALQGGPALPPRSSEQFHGVDGPGAKLAQFLASFDGQNADGAGHDRVVEGNGSADSFTMLSRLHGTLKGKSKL